MRVSLEWLFNMLSTENLGKILSSINLLKDERGNYLWTGHRKTAIWYFTFSI